MCYTRVELPLLCTQGFVHLLHAMQVLTVPYLIDNPEVGYVQARWTFANPDESYLTKVRAAGQCKAAAACLLTLGGNSMQVTLHDMLHGGAACSPHAMCVLMQACAVLFSRTRLESPCYHSCCCPCLSFRQDCSHQHGRDGSQPSCQADGMTALQLLPSLMQQVCTATMRGLPASCPLMLLRSCCACLSFNMCFVVKECSLLQALCSCCVHSCVCPVSGPGNLFELPLQV